MTIHNKQYMCKVSGNQLEKSLPAMRAKSTYLIFVGMSVDSKSLQISYLYIYIYIIHIYCSSYILLLVAFFTQTAQASDTKVQTQSKVFREEEAIPPVEWNCSFP